MGKNTQENLKEAFAGESQANRKYLAFAKKAEEEGYPQVAKLFRAAAEAETVHLLITLFYQYWEHFLSIKDEDLFPSSGINSKAL